MTWQHVHQSHQVGGNDVASVEVYHTLDLGILLSHKRELYLQIGKKQQN